jgi:hypothetical protein
MRLPEMNSSIITQSVSHLYPFLYPPVLLIKGQTEFNKEQDDVYQSWKINYDEEVTMKRIHLYGLLIIVILSLASVLVLAQDATEEPAAALPSDMETALVPCGEGVTGPCDLIATSVEDVAGVWAQYLLFPPDNIRGSKAYIRFNTDGTIVMSDSIEGTAEVSADFPSTTYRFEGTTLIFDPILTAPPPCNGAGVFQVRILKYGDVPVALRYVPISDECTARLQDLSQAAVWVAPGE